MIMWCVSSELHHAAAASVDGLSLPESAHDDPFWIKSNYLSVCSDRIYPRMPFKSPFESLFSLKSAKFVNSFRQVFSGSSF